MGRLPCPLPGLGDVLETLYCGGFMSKRDLASGFHHVKLATVDRRYVAFHPPVHGRLQRYVVLPFGTSQSPPLLTVPAQYHR